MKPLPPTGGLSAVTLSIPLEERIQTLCEQLTSIHGHGHISNEANGKHLNLACPKCLEQYGARELRSKHLSFNLDKYFRIGKWTPKIGAKLPKGYASCMKEHGAFNLNDLLNYIPLDQRGFPQVVMGKYTERNETATFVDDHGKVVPKLPGTCVPVHQLPQLHPCTQYLQYRDYDPVLLWAQFGAAYCTQGRRELEHDQEGGIPLNEQHGRGWRDTSQARLIFFSKMLGSNMAWQARVIENEEKKFYHPYSGQWVEADPIRYMTGKGSLRNRQLCGFDSAVANILPGDRSPLCVVTEGPLDAARFPRNGIAILGKHMSEEQALMLRLYFNRAVLAFDTGSDKAGLEVHNQVRELLESKGITVRDFWKGSEYDRDNGDKSRKIDAGMMGYQWCKTQLNNVSNF